MNMKICDICYKIGCGKKVEAKYRIGWTGGTKFDACEEHRNFCKGKTEKQVMSEVYNFKVD